MTDKLRQAAQQALEALEGVDARCITSGYVGMDGQYLKVVVAAKAALRDALEEQPAEQEQEQEPLAACEQAIAQRDELLGALRMLLLTAGAINDAPDGLLEMALESDNQEIRNEANAHLCARAAIAKATGKTK